jgi:two-component system, cell cycle response regulator
MSQQTVQSDSALPLKDMAAVYEKKIYDLQQLLEISRSLCSTLEFSTLIESILYICMCQMRVLGAGIFVLDALDANEFVLDTNYSGIDLDPEVSYRISSEDPIIEAISKNGTVYTLSELSSMIPSEADLQPVSSINPSLIVPLFLKNHLNGILLLGERIDIGDGTEFNEYERQQILSIASLSAIAINNAALLERSSTDMMTHLKLKYFFYNVLSNKLDVAVAQQLPLCVVMFDIDFFKRFNDTYGHSCGDYVLQMVAKIIKSGIRGQDLASRYGGEEFTVMLNNTNKDDAIAVADRIRSKIEEYDFCYENQHVQVTISVGVSEYNCDENPVTSAKMLVDQADQALYVSKRNGRNRVTFADANLIAEIKLPG